MRGTQVEALIESLGIDGPVDSLQRLSGGASRETWRLEIGGDHPESLILQRGRPGAVGTGPGMECEAELIRAAAAAGVPVPEVVAAGGEDSAVGAAFLMTRRIDGESIARRILRDEPFGEARRVLPAQMAAAAARIHAIDLSSVDGLAGGDQVTQFRQLADLLGPPHPAFELAFRWLDDHRPEGTGETLVHGDFRLGNFIIGPDGLRAVVDWELAHLGDPMEDLGWLCVRAWRFGGDQPVAGLGDYDGFFEAYEAAGGRTVDPAVVRWWEVLGTLKWGVMCIIQAESHLSGTSRSVELAAIGRRVCENEYDLLNLIAETPM